MFDGLFLLRGFSNLMYFAKLTHLHLKGSLITHWESQVQSPKINLFAYILL